MTLVARRRLEVVFHMACATSAFVGVILLALLLYTVFRDGWRHVDLAFLDAFPSRFPEKAGIKSALWGSIWLALLTAAFSLPLGIGASLYLEEFARKNALTRFIQLNISNLAGVPSIVYGMLGLAVFVRWMALDRSLISGALTTTLLTLPMIIIASQEALRAVPNSMRHAAYAVGGTPWQTVRDHVLPAAMPGILTGTILAMSRSIGETAPLIMIGALSYVAFVPQSLKDGFTVLPIQIFGWASRPQAAFHELAAGAILVLLAVLLSMNALAIALRNHYQKGHRW